LDTLGLGWAWMDLGGLGPVNFQFRASNFFVWFVEKVTGGEGLVICDQAV